ncbi:MAG: hypothetical protein IJM50_06480 [Lachnospiraceae bacterium]|nr:hypothetical protein [Lachnospiraceae bacterium]
MKTAAALLLGLVMIMTAACSNKPESTGTETQSSYESRTEELTTLEQTTVPAETVTDTETETEMPTQPSSEADVRMGDQLLKGKVADISKFTEKDIAVLRQLFKNAVIVGDSRVEAIVGYGILGEDVCISKYAGYAGDSKEICEQAAGLYPEKVLFFFGINDPKYYYDDYDKFIADYRADIDAYKAINPYSDIYVCNLIQVTEKRQSEVEAFKLVPEYNKRLGALCAEEGYGFIDGMKYLKNEHYLSDGSHFTEEFYCYLIQQFALEMGLWN